MTGGCSVRRLRLGFEVTEEFLGCAGKRKMFIVCKDKFSLGQFLFCVKYVDALRIIGDTVVRNKGNTQSDTREIDQQIVTGQFDLGNQIKLVLLKKLVQEFVCCTVLSSMRIG